MTDPLPEGQGAPGGSGPRGAHASLTYEPFFGLREKPFGLSADPRFLYKSPSHGPVFDALLAGIRRREGLIALTGEIGTGKTTLCRSVLRELDRRTFASFIPDPFVAREDLLKMLLVDFGVVSVSDLKHGRLKGASRPELSYPLYEFLDSLVPLQAFAVLVIDEAQHLPLPLLEEIRILSELERREKLLQVVLVGQPELRENLKLPVMRQVDQRVSVRCELTALDAADVAGYVDHRLAVASGGASRVAFTPAALEAVYLGSAGVPRLINRICDRALARACHARSSRIDPAFVWDAIGDVGAIPIARPAAEVRPLPVAEPPAVAATAAEDVSPVLSEFAVETVRPRPRRAEDRAAAAPGLRRSSSRWQPWAGAALAASLAVTAAAGAGLWYLGTQTVDRAAVLAALPPSPQSGFPARSITPRVSGGLMTEPSAADRVQPARSMPEGGKGYVIEVAAFGSRARARRLVEELTSAGYRAHDVEIDLGTRGRLRQVVIGGYSSALQVERDLRRLRELPGYADARLVVR